MGVRIWEGMWKEGAAVDLDVGQHHVNAIGSFEIDEGYRAKIQRGDSFDGHIIPWFYNGQMEAYHLPPFAHGGGYVLQVEKTDVKRSQMATVGHTWRDSRTSLDIRIAIPPGTYYGNSDAVFLPNDWAEWLEVPDSMTVTAYEHGGSGGRNRTYRAGRHDLPDGLRDGLSTIKVELDGWKLVGANSDMRMNDTVQQIGTYLVEGWANNDTGTEQEVEVALQASREATLAQHWNTSAKITSSVQVSGGVGVAEVTAGLSIELGAEYGQEKSENRGQSISISPTVTVPPHTRYKCSAIFQVMKGQFPITRTLENEVTGERITEDGTLTADYAGRYEVNWSDDE